MRAVEIYRNGVFAGILTEENHNMYVFRYDDVYYNDTAKASISLTLPKIQQEYHRFHYIQSRLFEEFI